MSGKGCASQAGIELLRAAMKRNGWTQAETAKMCGFARSTLNQILAGQSVKLENLQGICDLFELEVGQVLVQEVLEDIDRLVQQLRQASAVSLRQRCGTIRVLDMTQPVDTGAIYTDVNILEKVAGKTRREIQELMTDCGVEGFDRFFLGGVRQKRVPGLEAVLGKKLLMILGRPGAGKTTFLKRLAIECLNGTFLADRLPVFVTLKEFAEAEGKPGILSFMAQAVIPPNPPSKGGNRIEVPLLKGDLGGSSTMLSTSQFSLAQVLAAGKALILLDGLDEVMEKDHDRVIREIREFAQTYSQNHIVITCRIAAREYIFQQFTEVEMADFDDEQIQTFADKWFKTTEKNPESITGKMFWKELESRKPVKELATNPLLLTLLCLEFDNTAAFPQSRSELYERALNVLLAKWDGQRRIRRDEVYKGLSLKRKETMLGQLAMFTFERGDYFFKERVATQQIEKFIRNLPGAKEDPAALEVDSLAVLKSVESQHGLLAERAKGIYSFSHLTFQEYFTAKNILDLSNPPMQEVALKKLTNHIDEKRWKEVFLLVVEGLDNSDYLLQMMKQQIDRMIVNEAELQRFLEWIQEKSISINTKCKPFTIRAFYYALDLQYHSKVPDCDFNLSLNLDNSLILAYNHALSMGRPLAYDRALALPRALTAVLDCTDDLKLKLQLKGIYDRLPDSKNSEQFRQWYERNGHRWTEDLRQIMIKYRNIGHDWQFTDEQKQKLQKYYDANLLLAQCLNSECYLSREVREEIEETMLLPIAEIERWKRENRREKGS